MLSRSFAEYIKVIRYDKVHLADVDLRWAPTRVRIGARSS